MSSCCSEWTPKSLRRRASSSPVMPCSACLSLLCALLALYLSQSFARTPSHTMDSALFARPTASSARAVMRRLVASSTENCGVVRGAASPQLLAASASLCAASGPLDLHYWQGYETEQTDVDVAAQFARQLAKDIEEEKLGAVASHWLPMVQEFITARLLRMYDCEAVSAAAEERGLLFYLRLQINSRQACIKFHDDYVGVRMVAALCGEPTVVAPAASVAWDFWEQSGGQLTMAELKEGARKRLVLAFNRRVCPKQAELQPAVGDVLLMKGGLLAGRPCVHRAPYSADDGSEEVPARLLVTLDCISKAECQDLIDMYAGEGDMATNSDDEEEEEGEGV